MRYALRFTVALGLTLLAGGATIAQRASGAPERWDDDLATLEGTVTEVSRPFATFEAGGETYRLHMGPYWFWEERGYALESGDQVTIKGQVSAARSTRHLYPHTITRGRETYVLAGDDGVPLWSGAGYGRGRRGGAWGGGGAWQQRHGRAQGGPGWRGAGCRCARFNRGR